MRTIVDISQDDMARLAELCRERGESRAEIVGLAIHFYLEQHDSRGKDAFGIWKNRAHDGVTSQRAIRSEWDE